MKYTDPKLEIVVLEKSDIVTPSPKPGDNETPIIPYNPTDVGDDKF